MLSQLCDPSKRAVGISAGSAVVGMGAPHGSKKQPKASASGTGLPAGAAMRAVRLRRGVRGQR